MKSDALEAMTVEQLADLRDQLDAERLKIVERAKLVKKIHDQKLRHEQTINRLSVVKPEDLDKMIQEAGADPEKRKALIDQLTRKRNEIRVSASAAAVGLVIEGAKS